MVDGDIVPPKDLNRCILCGHCAALCPTGALSHGGLYDAPMAPVPALPAEAADAFAALVRRRRSHRHFAKTPVPREQLEYLVDLCRFSPTGANTQTVALNVIERPERIAELAQATVTHFMALIAALDREAQTYTTAGKAIPSSVTAGIERHRRYRNLQRSLDSGRDPIFYHAPAVVVFHASESARTPKDDCVIAAHTLTLGATALGLGSCYIGLFTRAANENPAVWSALDLPKGSRVFSTVMLGIPKLTFHRTVSRPPLPTKWE